MSDTNLYSAEQVFVKIFDDSDDEDDLHDLASDSDSDDQHSPSSSNNASALLQSKQPLTSVFSNSAAVPGANQAPTSAFSNPDALLGANQPSTSTFSNPSALLDANQPSTSAFSDPGALLDANQAPTSVFSNPGALLDANQTSSSAFSNPSALLDANQPSTSAFSNPGALLDANQAPTSALLDADQPSTSAFTNLAAVLDNNQFPAQSSTPVISDQLCTENDYEDDNVFQPPQRKRRRFAPHEKHITDISTALQEEHYHPLDLTLNEEKSYRVELQKANKNQRGAVITWSNTPPAMRGRQARSDVIQGTIGVRQEFKDYISPKATWELFFTLDILAIIVELTNKKIGVVRNGLSQQILNESKYSFLYDTSTPEMLALVGLMYLRGLLGLANHSIDVLFHNLTGSPIFGATMSKNRFKFLLSHISFDDIATRPRRWLFDRFAAFREIFELFNENCARIMIPGAYLALDETLYPMRSNISFKQFNPSKPAKYGMLFRSINSCRYSYTFSTSVYAGRPRNYVSDPDMCRFHVRGTEEVVKTLVLQLEKRVDLSGRNISYDRLYTSIALAKWLLERDITCIGTIKAHRKGIPPEIKNVSNRDVGSYEIFWNEPEKRINLNSYVVNTKSSGKRNVLMLSTIHPILGISKDVKPKPALYKLYDYTKGGTDIVDQKISFYSCKPKSRKWTIVAFSYLMDTCRVNASTIMALNNGIDPRKLNSFNFGFDLVLELVRPFIEQRSRNGLTSDIVRKIKLVLGEQDVAVCATALLTPYPPKSGRPRRCEMCKAEIRGPGMKKQKDKLAKQSGQCQSCGKTVCQRHRFQFCTNCH